MPWIRGRLPESPASSAMRCTPPARRHCSCVASAAVLALAVRYEVTVPENLGVGAEPEGFASDESVRSPSTSAESNGSAVFAAGGARLTNNFGPAGSTTFTFQFHEGTQPNPADGIAFVIQA